MATRHGQDGCQRLILARDAGYAAEACDSDDARHRTLVIGVLPTAGLWLLFAPVWAAQPERPRAAVDTRDARPTGRTIAVAAGGNVPDCAQRCAAGGRDHLEAGATVSGAVHAAEKTGTGWITVRTAAPTPACPPPARG